MKVEKVVVVGLTAAVAATGVAAEAGQKNTIARSTVVFDGRKPRISGPARIQLEPGDRVLLRVEGPEEIDGRTLRAEVHCEIRHEEGYCPKTIWHEPHQHEIKSPTRARALVDFMPRLKFAELPVPIPVTERTGIIVAPKAMTLVLDQDLHVTGSNLVLDHGAALTGQEQQRLSQVVADCARSGHRGTHVAVPPTVAPGRVVLTLHVEVVRPDVR